MAKILIIDDDRVVSNMMARGISEQDHTVDCSATLGEGIQVVEIGNYDVVYLDVRMPDGNGLEALPVIKRASSQPEVIIITGVADVDGAKLAIKNGAWDYIEKPCTLDEMSLPLMRALEYRKEKLAVRRPIVLKRGEIRGNSPLILECLDQVAKVSMSDVTVLITGETGTGKELFAKAIHENSARSGKDFVVVDCTVLPETLVEGLLFGHVRGAFTGANISHDGLIKQADGGTLFLDEIGDLPLSIQKTFLRVLQERCYRPVGAKHEEFSNFRLVAATNRDLDEMVSHGEFRQDLLYRLRSLIIDLPPLRKRTGDIKELALYFALKFCEDFHMDAKGFSPDFFDVLSHYNWPGNVREIVNAIRIAVVAAQHEASLYPKHLPEDIRIHKTVSALRKKTPEIRETVTPILPDPLPPFREYRLMASKNAEREYLLRLMYLTDGNIDEALRSSGLGRSRLYGLLKEHGISIK